MATITTLVVVISLTRLCSMKVLEYTSTLELYDYIRAIMTKTYICLAKMLYDTLKENGNNLSQT